jgi:hypothetical protein
MVNLSSRFHGTKLEEEREQDTARVISLRFNADELGQLKHLMDLLDTENEGRVVKILMRLGYARLHDTFLDADLKWMSRRDRSRGIGVKGD